MSTNFDEDEISKNLARFTEQQIEEYKAANERAAARAATQNRTGKRSGKRR